MRPGRLDRKVYVPLPDKTTRLEILKLKLSKMPTSNDVDINKLVDLTENYSGAEVRFISFNIFFISWMQYKILLFIGNINLP